MSPGAFLRVVNRIAPQIDDRCAAETRDGLALILQNLNSFDKPMRFAVSYYMCGSRRPGGGSLVGGAAIGAIFRALMQRQNLAAAHLAILPAPLREALLPQRCVLSHRPPLRMIPLATDIRAIFRVCADCLK